MVVVSVANILMNRTRSRLIRYLITHGPASCDEVAAALEMSVSAVRRHVSLLREAGMASASSGRYSAQPHEIQRQLDDLAASFNHQPATPETP